MSEALQCWPEVPSIAHFCSLFRQQFDLVDFEIEELESSLLTMAQEGNNNENLATQLIVGILKGCLPIYKHNINGDNYSMYLRQLLQTSREEAEEDGLAYSFDDPFVEGEDTDYTELGLRDRVRVLHQLCELRLLAEDVPEKVRELDAECLRVEPLGADADGTVYWYFFGTRLYQEVPKVRPKKKKKEEEEKPPAKAAKLEAKPAKEPGWSLVCSSQQDWERLTDSYKKSKKKQDKELYETLSVSFLPDITKMFVDKEREEKIKLMMMNRRTSSRQEKKRCVQEEAERSAAARIEEEKKREEETRMRQEKENRQNLLKARDKRAKQRQRDQGQLLFQFHL